MDYLEYSIETLKIEVHKHRMRQYLQVHEISQDFPFRNLVR